MKKSWADYHGYPPEPNFNDILRQKEFLEFEFPQIIRLGQKKKLVKEQKNFYTGLTSSELNYLKEQENLEKGKEIELNLNQDYLENLRDSIDEILTRNELENLLGRNPKRQRGGLIEEENRQKIRKIIKELKRVRYQQEEEEEVSQKRYKRLGGDI